MAVMRHQKFIYTPTLTENSSDSFHYQMFRNSLILIAAANSYDGENEIQLGSMPLVIKLLYHRCDFL